MSSWAMTGCTACTAGLRRTKKRTSLTPWACAQWHTGGAAQRQQQAMFGLIAAFHRQGNHSCNLQAGSGQTFSVACWGRQACAGHGRG
jgi:hypothetical protein